MNKLIEKLAERSLFDVDQILAEILCPDHDGVELGDAWNKLPEEVRRETVEILIKRQEEFVKLVVRDCVNVVRAGNYSHTADPGFEASLEIMEHFGITYWS